MVPSFLFMSSVNHVFNQYYFDLLKKLKSISRDAKHESHDAREILRGIKKHYQSYDRLSDEFRTFFNQSAEAWEAYGAVDASDEALTAWVNENGSVSLYKDIPLVHVQSVMKDPLILHHYLTILTIFRTEVASEHVSAVLDILRNMGDDNAKNKIDSLGDDTIKHLMHRLSNLYSKRAEKVSKQSFMDNMADIENTSLGKLAKEILEEVNVDDLQASLGDGDIMKALSNPDGGLVKLLGTVSQKMISKMSSGEIKQENLLQDAMKLATQLGGNALPKELGALGNLASMFGGGSGDDDGGFDFSKIANMMGSMGLGPKPNAGGMRTRPNTAAASQHMRRVVKAKELRRKLEKKRQEGKENVHGHVEDE
jgi:hypothetical protein